MYFNRSCHILKAGWLMLEVSVCQIFFARGSPKIILYISCRSPANKNVYRPENKETVGKRERLIQYCQLLDKNSHISGNIWN
jgi:hypothetical protein